MSFENICPICNEKTRPFVSSGRDFFIHNGKSEPFDVYFCEKCSIGYSTPFLTDSELSKYYPDDFEAYIPKTFFKAFVQRLKYKSDLKIISSKFDGRTVSIFEIGAGRGEFLSEAKKKCFLVKGIEPGEIGRKYSKEQFDIFLSSELASEVVFEDKYDVVAMRHVLEHINNPVSLLDQILNEGLRPCGTLFLKLPNLDSWEAKLFGKFWHGLDLPRHRIHYTKEGIINLLNSVGFSDVEVIQEVVPTDIMRSLKYYSQYGSSKSAKLVSKLLRLIPDILQFVICQFFSIVMSPFGAGRIIVTARR